MKIYISKTGEIFFNNSRDLVGATLILNIKSSATRYTLAIFPFTVHRWPSRSGKNTRDDFCISGSVVRYHAPDQFLSGSISQMKRKYFRSTNQRSVVLLPLLLLLVIPFLFPVGIAISAGTTLSETPEKRDDILPPCSPSLPKPHRAKRTAEFDRHTAEEGKHVAETDLI